MRKFELEDPRRLHQAREALRLIERQHEAQRGVEHVAVASAMATPGKATLTQALAGTATLNSVSQLSRSITGASVDVANLEQANRTGDFKRASWARASILRFIDQLPWLLGGVSRRNTVELRLQAQEVLTRAEVALANAPTISQAARDAAARGDYSLFRADLAPWLAKAQVITHVDATAQRASRSGGKRTNSTATTADAQMPANAVDAGGAAAPTPTRDVQEPVLDPGAGIAAVSAASAGPPATALFPSSVRIRAAESATAKELDPDSDDEHEIAARGLAGPGGPLPYLDEIQKSFGNHDVSSVKAHVGGAAATANDKLGAQAYAYGNAIAFASAPDLHTAAHEAAHIVQQRRGVPKTRGGDDSYERHADLVADRVVRGQSVALLLTAPPSRGSATAVIQRKSRYEAARHTGSENHDLHSTEGKSHDGEAGLEHPAPQTEGAPNPIARVRTTLLPKYRNAVDALDGAAAHAIAKDILVAVYAATQTQAHAHIGAGAPANKLDEDVTAFITDLAVQLGPQIYKGKLVLGRLEPLPLGKDPVATLAGEAKITAVLLEVIHQVRSIAGIDSATGRITSTLSAAQRKQIAAFVEPWHSRPINYAFLVRALEDIGLWNIVAGEKGPSGNTLSATNNKAMQQALLIGRTADVGNYDDQQAADILSDAPDWARQALLPGQHSLPDADTAAKTIYKRILSAAPAARGAIVRQLSQWGRLDALGNHLPWRNVVELHDSIGTQDLEAAKLLEPYFVGKGGRESLHKNYMRQAAELRAAGHPVLASTWNIWDFVHNALTLGHLHRYSNAFDEHEQGFTTDNQFIDASNKEVGRAALLGGVTYATGGLAAGAGEGVAASAGLGGKAAQIADGALTAGTIGMTDTFAGDVYDQTFMDKQGFSSPGEYASTFGIAAAFGGAVTALLPTKAPVSTEGPPVAAGAKTSPPKTNALTSQRLQRANNGDFHTEPTALRDVHAALCAENQGGTITPIRYHAESNTAAFEATHSSGHIRIVANIRPRITAAAELVSSENRIIGNPISAGEGHRLLQQLNEGRLEALSRVGVEVPPGIKLKPEIEFGLGEVDNGRYVVVLGEPAGVDWAHLPGVKPMAHTHPPTRRNDLPGGTLALDDILKDTAGEPLLVRELVMPSPEDVSVMARLGVDGHRVVTPYAVYKGHVMKPAVGDPSPRLEWVIEQPRTAGLTVKGDPVYEATLIGEVAGHPVIRTKVWSIEPHEPTPSNPSCHLMSPPKMVPASTQSLSSSKETL